MIFNFYEPTHSFKWLVLQILPLFFLAGCDASPGDIQNEPAISVRDAHKIISSQWKSVGDHIYIYGGEIGVSPEEDIMFAVSDHLPDIVEFLCNSDSSYYAAFNNINARKIVFEDGDRYLIFWSFLSSELVETTCA